MKSGTAVVASAAAVAAVIAVIAFVAQPTSSNRARRVGAVAAVTASPEAEQVRTWALKLAAKEGYGTYDTLQWVKTTRGESSEALFGIHAASDGSVNSDWGDPVYAIQMTGSFVYHSGDHGDYKGSVMIANLDANTGSAVDETLLYAPTDLSKLGMVQN